MRREGDRTQETVAPCIDDSEHLGSVATGRGILQGEMASCVDWVAVGSRLVGCGGAGAFIVRYAEFNDIRQSAADECRSEGKGMGISRPTPCD